MFPRAPCNVLAYHQALVRVPLVSRGTRTPGRESLLEATGEEELWRGATTGRIPLRAHQFVPIPPVRTALQPLAVLLPLCFCVWCWLLALVSKIVLTLHCCASVCFSPPLDLLRQLTDPLTWLHYLHPFGVKAVLRKVRRLFSHFNQCIFIGVAAFCFFLRREMQYGAIIMTKLNVLSDIELDSFHSPLIPLLCNRAVLSRGSNGVAPSSSSYCFVTTVCGFFFPFWPTVQILLLHI